DTFRQRKSPRPVVVECDAHRGNRWLSDTRAIRLDVVEWHAATLVFLPAPARARIIAADSRHPGSPSEVAKNNGRAGPSFCGQVEVRESNSHSEAIEATANRGEPGERPDAAEERASPRDLRTPVSSRAAASSDPRRALLPLRGSLP